jgi:hypothetical protein
MTDKEEFAMVKPQRKETAALQLGKKQYFNLFYPNLLLVSIFHFLT